MLADHWYVYLSVSAITNTLFLFVWNRSLKKIESIGMKSIGVFFITSFMNAWGIDVIQKVNDISTLMHVLQVSLGCWILFAAATMFRHESFAGFSKRKFWLDYCGDFIGFVLMGLVIFALT